MNTFYWHMNATKGGANLVPGVNLLPGANLQPGPGASCAHEHGFWELMIEKIMLYYDTFLKFTKKVDATFSVPGNIIWRNEMKIQIK